MISAGGRQVSWGGYQYAQHVYRSGDVAPSTSFIVTLELDLHLVVSTQPLFTESPLVIVTLRVSFSHLWGGEKRSQIAVTDTPELNAAIGVGPVWNRCVSSIATTVYPVESTLRTGRQGRQVRIV